MVQGRNFFINILPTPWLNWIEQPPPKGQVAGSNPAGVATFIQKKINFLRNGTIEGFII